MSLLELIRAGRYGDAMTVRTRIHSNAAPERLHELLTISATIEDDVAFLYFLSSLNKSSRLSLSGCFDYSSEAMLARMARRLVPDHIASINYQQRLVVFDAAWVQGWLKDEVQAILAAIGREHGPTVLHALYKTLTDRGYSFAAHGVSPLPPGIKGTYYIGKNILNDEDWELLLVDSAMQAPDLFEECLRERPPKNPRFLLTRLERKVSPAESLRLVRRLVK
jgi:hypothetical protein